MFELIALAVAAAAGVGGHLKSKGFVRDRLRYTTLVEHPALGLAAGVGAALVAAPVVALLPIVGAGTAIAVGVGVGSGVAIGARQARDGWHPED
ncbi:MAG: hypothetical protein KY453_11185 [Gemmatimonadetes bacterium]|nr:hypothetical protein [Gemmatimonadota bacterium]